MVHPIYVFGLLYSYAKLCSRNAQIYAQWVYFNIWLIRFKSNKLTYVRLTISTFGGVFIQSLAHENYKNAPGPRGHTSTPAGGGHINLSHLIDDCII